MSRNWIEVPGVNPREFPYPQNVGVGELFLRLAADRPGSVAIDHQGKRLTYRDLDHQAGTLCARLTRAGVGAGHRVGVYGDKSPEALTAILGILYAGAAYVPLDPRHPAPRLQAMVDAAQVRTVVTLPGEKFPLRGLASIPATGHRNTVAPSTPAPTSPNSLAYVMFTSGTTGPPKAVGIPHRAILRLTLGADYVTFGPADRVLHAAPLGFDSSTLEIWGALLAGARLVTMDSETLLTPGALKSATSRDGITVAFLTASLFRHIAQSEPDALKHLDQVLVGGDVLEVEAVRRVFRAGPPRRLVNAYGPTENTTFSTAHVVCEPERNALRIPIGRPIAHSTAYIDCDTRGADGSAEGELCVGGDGLAVGYLGDPEATARKFIPHPLTGSPGDRLYRTGDRVKMTPGGPLEFLGRQDRQVKIRGFRVEPEEVEAALVGHPQVAAAAVSVEGEGAGRALVAHLSPAGPDRPTVEQLRRDFSRVVPPYMIPSRFAWLDQLPMNINGKIDRAALNAPDLSPGGAASMDPPHREVAAVWSETLQAGPLALDSNFFSLGGDSLKAAQATFGIQKALGLPAERATQVLRALLDNPTLSGFTDTLEALRDAGDPPGDTSEGVDFRAEASLRSRLPEASGPEPHPLEAQCILLTGASGFLGAYILSELIRTTAAHIYCPVRARDAGHAEERLRYVLSGYGLEVSQLGKRVTAFPADFAGGSEGWPQRQFDLIASDLDLIIHSAAHVNFLYPYERAREANVESTRRLVELAGPRRIPLHFVSTIAVLAGFGGAGKRSVQEGDPLDFPEYLRMGYPETKWVAEVLLAEAASQGLPVSVYRPYEITGDLQTGAWNTATALPALFKMIADTGCAPDVDLPLDLVPVDRLAAALVHIATRQPVASKVYHLTNPKPALLPAMTRRLRAAGFPVEEVSYGDWLERFSAFALADPRHPFSAFLPIFLDRAKGGERAVKELYFSQTFPEFSRVNAESALRRAGVTLPAVDDDLLDLYVRHFLKSGYIAPPV